MRPRVHGASVCIVLVGLSVAVGGRPLPASASPPAALTAMAAGGPAVWGIRVPVRLPRLLALPSRGAVFTVRIVRQALRQLGAPYRWSGIGKGGFDCSGLVLHVFAALGVAVPHSSVAQYRAGIAVPPALLGPGDLVFFRTYTHGPSHVGIYLGRRLFIHASFSRGVIVSSLDEPYYRSRYLGARRL
jgi:hypothetical protein